MNAEQVLEWIVKLVDSFEKEKEEASRKCEELRKQAENAQNKETIDKLYDKIFWERSKECTLESVIFRLKLDLSNFKRSN